MAKRKPGDFLTRKEVSAVLRCSRTSLFRLDRAGKLVPYKKLGRLLYARNEVLGFLESGRTNAAPAEIENGKVSALGR